MRAAFGAAGLLVTGLVIGGCSKVTTAANIQNGACSATLSGSQTGTYDCSPFAMVFDSGKDTTGFGYHVAATASTPQLSTGIVWSGQPAATDYTGANSGGAITVSAPGGAVWTAAPGTGTYDLHVTSVGSSLTSGNSTAYASTGTLTATLQPMGGTPATGTVTVSVTF